MIRIKFSLIIILMIFFKTIATANYEKKIFLTLKFKV